MNDTNGGVSATAFLDRVRETIDRVAASEAAQVARAADIITEALGRDGIVQAFGTGHSQATAMEIAGRAGGLIPTNRISFRDLVIQGEPASILADPLIERDPDLARRLYDAASVHPSDVFVIASNSGINGSVVGLADIAKKNDHPVIAILSRQHSAQVESRHPSGRKLGDIADVVLDNGGPFGDAVLPLPGGGAACAVSSMTAALLAQMITAEVLNRIIASGQKPPVYLSANVPGGDAHNDDLLQRYAGRIRPGG